MKNKDLQNSLPYFYSGIDINKFKFFAAPQILFDSDFYSSLHMAAKVLFCIGFDKVTLSQKNSNRFSDEDGRIYIVYPLKEMINDLQLGRTTIAKLLNELEEFGLFERVASSSADRTNRVYVKNCMGYGEKREDRFFYGKEDLDKYRFYMLPKELIVNPAYRSLSLDAKVLYMFLLERLKLSKDNEKQYSDEHGRLYVFYSIANIKNRMSCSNDKALRLLNELENVGLIKRAEQKGYRKATKIYVLDFASGEKVRNESENVEILQCSEIGIPMFGNRNTNVRKPEYQCSETRTPMFNNQNANVHKSESNNTYINNTYKKHSLNSTKDSESERMNSFKERFFASIELEALTEVNESLIHEDVTERIRAGEIKAADYKKEFNKIYEPAIKDAVLLQSMADNIVRYYAKSGSVLTLSGETLTKEELEKKLLSIRSSHFLMAKDRLISVRSPINNFGAYAVSILLDLSETMELHVQNIANSLID